MIIEDLERQATALRRWQKEKEYCKQPLYINIWHKIGRTIRVTHAFYMNDERDRDPFYLEYDR